MKSDADEGHPQEQRWRHFEDEVYKHVKAKISQCQLMLDPNHATVYRTKGYHSKDRQKDIIFDVVIEAFTEPAHIPSLIWIWECKDYPHRRVSVDEIEEFVSKLWQIGIGSVKGTVVTRVGFETGAVAYAKSQRIGLVTLQKKLVTVTHYERCATEYEILILASDHGLTLSGKEYDEEDRLNLDGIIEIELRHLGLMP
jgi:hypothetical protein